MSSTSSQLRKSTRLRKLSIKAKEIISPSLAAQTLPNDKIIGNRNTSDSSFESESEGDFEHSDEEEREEEAKDEEDRDTHQIKKRKLEIQSDEEVIFESDLENFESDLSDYEDYITPDFKKLEMENNKKKSDVGSDSKFGEIESNSYMDPVEKLLLYKNNNSNEFFLEEDVEEDEGQNTSTNEPIKSKNKRSFENLSSNENENENFLKLVDDNLRLSTNIYPNNEHFIRNIKNYETYYSLFNYLNNNFSSNRSMSGLQNNSQNSQPQQQGYQNEQSSPVEDNSNFDEYLSYDDDEDELSGSNSPITPPAVINESVTKDLANAVSPALKMSSSKYFEYRFHDHLNLALPEISSSPNQRNFNYFFNHSKKKNNNGSNANLINILNKSSLLTGKAGEMVCTGVVLNEFLL